MSEEMSSDRLAEVVAGLERISDRLGSEDCGDDEAATLAAEAANLSTEALELARDAMQRASTTDD